MMVLSCVCLLWLIWRDLVIVSLLNDICYCRNTLVFGECLSSDVSWTRNLYPTSVGSGNWLGTGSMMCSFGLLQIYMNTQLLLMTGYFCSGLALIMLYCIVT